MDSNGSIVFESISVNISIFPLPGRIKITRHRPRQTAENVVNTKYIIVYNPSFPLVDVFKEVNPRY